MGPRKRRYHREKRQQASPKENLRARPERLEPGQQGCTQKRTGSAMCKEPQTRADTGQPEPPPHTMRDQNWNRPGQKTHSRTKAITPASVKKEAVLPTRRKEKQRSVNARQEGKGDIQPQNKIDSPRARTRKGNDLWGNARKTRKRNPDTPTAVNMDHKGDAGPKETGGKGGDTDRNS
ncbi:hypothetical protein NDU88_002374 [Pleurodeles waltl]|uniref:Uncharacterized protein n=1 Tax=Pleurodeles waltl TaxID=8319 RepID=A0AAV7Q6W9_PLEWA|nr:hypothetical protein NDU88_002374 [Pleurodeles waltl]